MVRFIPKALERMRLNIARPMPLRTIRRKKSIKKKNKEPFGVGVVCPKCGKVTRIEYKVQKDNKVRVCKKCNAEIK